MLKVLDNGGYAISSDLTIPGTGVAEFVFARGWLLEIINLNSGEYYFYKDNEPVRPFALRFGVFYPPFTFVRTLVKDVMGQVDGIGSDEMFAQLPQQPFIFDTDFEGGFCDLSQVFNVLDSCRNRQSIEVTAKPSLISIKAKRLIDKNFLIYPSIARIADRLGISHAHLSRQFKKDYGIAPSAYLHKLRVAEATHRLSRGEEIIEISEDVGYNDLSRFYKQFRKVTNTSPAACRQTLDDRAPHKRASKNAKT